MKKKKRLWIYVSLLVGLLVKVGIFIFIIAGRGKEESRNDMTGREMNSYRVIYSEAVFTAKDMHPVSMTVNDNENGRITENL